jgi:hypothetical protein
MVSLSLLIHSLEEPLMIFLITCLVEIKVKIYVQMYQLKIRLIFISEKKQTCKNADWFNRLINRNYFIYYLFISLSFSLFKMFSLKQKQKIWFVVKRKSSIIWNLHSFIFLLLNEIIKWRINLLYFLLFEKKFTFWSKRFLISFNWALYFVIFTKSTL